MTNGWHRKRSTPANRQRIREYNSPAHKQQRRAGQAQVDAGQAHCWRCRRWLPPGRPWHVGHDDHDRTLYRGTECVPCNLSAAARKGNAMRRNRPRSTRTW